MSTERAFLCECSKELTSLVCSTSVSSIACEKSVLDYHNSWTSNKVTGTQSLSMRPKLMVVCPLRTPLMPYAAAAKTCAIPMSPYISSGDTSTVNNLERVRPTVILPKQSSVSSVGESSQLKRPLRKPMLGCATSTTCAVPPTELAIVSTRRDRGLFFLSADLFRLFLCSVGVVITNNPSA